MMKNYFTLLLFLSFTFMKSYSQEISPCQGENNLFGYCDSSGKVFIPYQYEYAGEFRDGRAFVFKNKKTAMINKKGALLIPFKYDGLFPCDANAERLLASIDSTWGFLNLKGEATTGFYKVKYPISMFGIDGGYCYASQKDWFNVSKNNKWGLMNMKGQFLVPLEYDYLRIQYYRNSEQDTVDKMCIAAMKNGKFSLLNSSCKPITGYEYDDFLGFWDNAVFFLKDKEVVILNCTDGKRISKVKSEVNFQVLRNSKDKNGLVSAEGKIIMPFIYDYMYDHSGDYYLRIGNSNGMADSKGTILIEPKYTSVKRLCTDDTTMFVVEQESKYALFLISEKGKPAKQLTDFKYYSVYCYDIGVAKVVIGDKSGTVDKTGKETWNK